MESNKFILLLLALKDELSAKKAMSLVSLGSWTEYMDESGRAYYVKESAWLPVELSNLNRLNRCLKVEPEHNQNTCASHIITSWFLKPAKEGRPSTWEHPMDQVYRELLGVIRQASSTSAPAKSREESPGEEVAGFLTCKSEFHSIPPGIVLTAMCCGQNIACRWVEYCRTLIGFFFHFVRLLAVKCVQNK